MINTNASKIIEEIMKPLYAALEEQSQPQPKTTLKERRAAAVQEMIDRGISPTVVEELMQESERRVAEDPLEFFLLGGMQEMEEKMNAAAEDTKRQKQTNQNLTPVFSAEDVEDIYKFAASLGLSEDTINKIMCEAIEEVLSEEKSVTITLPTEPAAADLPELKVGDMIIVNDEVDGEEEQVLCKVLVVPDEGKKQYYLVFNDELGPAFMSPELMAEIFAGYAEEFDEEDNTLDDTSEQPTKSAFKVGDRVTLYACEDLETVVTEVLEVNGTYIYGLKNLPNLLVREDSLTLVLEEEESSKFNINDHVIFILDNELEKGYIVSVEPDIFVNSVYEVYSDEHGILEFCEEELAFDK